MSRVVADMARTSLPAMSGAAMMAQRLKWARYSSSVMPPFPTSSMSGSFHAPGRATLACCDERSSRESMDDHLSRRSEEHTSELQSRSDLVCRLLLEKKKTTTHGNTNPYILRVERGTLSRGIYTIAVLFDPSRS